VKTSVFSETLRRTFQKLCRGRFVIFCFLCDIQHSQFSLRKLGANLHQHSVSVAMFPLHLNQVKSNVPHVFVRKPLLEGMRWKSRLVLFLFTAAAMSFPVYVALFATLLKHFSPISSLHRLLTAAQSILPQNHLLGHTLTLLSMPQSKWKRISLKSASIWTSTNSLSNHALRQRVFSFFIRSSICMTTSSSHLFQKFQIQVVE